EAAALVLTRDQQSKIATKRAEMQGDPSLQKASLAAAKGSTRGGGGAADHKSMDMYGAFGSGGGENWGVGAVSSGGGEDWGGGGGGRGDE
ncbi:hypothetical protein T484DRAFT_1829844, partial [Baffinella frigidus]